MEPLAGESTVVPESPEHLSLPFAKWRPYQAEAVERIVAAFRHCRAVIMEAPTGSGKTVIGAAVSRMLGGDALYLSSTIHLQQQQLRTLPKAKTATGRSNHPCLMKDHFDRVIPYLTAAEAPCACDLALKQECSYYNQWYECSGAEDAVLNYAYATRVLRTEGIRIGGFTLPNPFRDRELMVCDEAHLLERALLSADGVEVRVKTFRELGVKCPESTDIEDWYDWAHRVNPYLEELLGSAVASMREGKGLGKVRVLRGALRTVKSLKDMAGTKRPMYVGRTEYGYRIQPLWAWARGDSLLYRHSPNVLVMSATLGAAPLLAKLTGVDTEAWEHIEVPSTFPVQNRTVYYWPLAKMKYGMAQDEKVKQSKGLDYLAGLFPTSPGVVHCASYELGRFLEKTVAPETRRRVLTHRPDTRAATFRSFEESPGNTILVSPAATTGVDWDFVGWAMIPKVPYPSLGDDITRLRYEYVTEDGDAIGRRVYQQEAALAVVQASGRHVRTEVSKGVTVITDGNFWSLFKHIAPQAFPAWFKEAVVWKEVK